MTNIPNMNKYGLSGQIAGSSEMETSKGLLDQLIDEVSTQKGFLAGGTKLVPGVEELQRLRETRVTFGNPL